MYLLRSLQRPGVRGYGVTPSFFFTLLALWALILSVNYFGSAPW
jgi:hypothetical protein